MRLLYSEIGVSIITTRDMANLGLDTEAIFNSIELLKYLDLISLESYVFKKTDNYSMDDLPILLREKCSKQLAFLLSLKLIFDESNSLFWLHRNLVPLWMSGFLVLLEGIAVIRLDSKKIYIVNPSYFGLEIQQESHKLSLDSLHHKLEVQNRLGDEAELKALESETANMRRRGDKRDPIRISLLDTSAGYDIASYNAADSVKIDKYIEVKSCQDERLNFFASSNEIGAMKRFGPDYFLYLYNRKEHSFTILQNPYHSVIKCTDWTLAPQSFEIRRIKFETFSDMVPKDKAVFEKSQ
jgi:hypothetical protein